MKEATARLFLRSFILTLHLSNSINRTASSEREGAKEKDKQLSDWNVEKVQQSKYILVLFLRWYKVSHLQKCWDEARQDVSKKMKVRKEDKESGWDKAAGEQKRRSCNKSKGKWEEMRGRAATFQQRRRWNEERLSLPLVLPRSQRGEDCALQERLASRGFYRSWYKHGGKTVYP